MLDLFSLSAIKIGMHIGSVHIPSKDHFNNVNPGIYARHDNGATVGLYYNSFKRPSLYGGWTWEYDRYALTAGLITGYQKKAVECTGDRSEFDRCWDGHSRGFLSPVIAPSVAIPELHKYLGVTPRITVLTNFNPKDSSVIHLSIERKFK